MTMGSWGFFKWLLTVLLLGSAAVAGAQTLGSEIIVLETPYGNAAIRLYEETPRHRENFMKLVRAGYFNRTFFHRVIPDFVSQGGDPDSLYLDTASLNAQQQWIDPEFHPALFHKKGVLAAGRDDNPEKRSFTTQIYLVQGKVWTDAGLDSLEEGRLQGYKIPAVHREVYKTLGGLPFLDQHYSIFGEVVDGLELIDKLGAVATDRNDAPLKPIPIKMSLRLLK